MREFQTAKIFVLFSFIKDFFWSVHDVTHDVTPDVTPERSDAHMANDTHRELAQAFFFFFFFSLLRSCQDSMSQYQSGAKWPLGFCMSLNRSHFGEDTDAAYCRGDWIKPFQMHPWLPSAQWVMLVNFAIRCIVNSRYLSVYSSWVRVAKTSRLSSAWHQVGDILSCGAMTRALNELENVSAGVCVMCFHTSP